MEMHVTVIYGFVQTNKGRAGKGGGRAYYRTNQRQRTAHQLVTAHNLDSFAGERASPRNRRRKRRDPKGKTGKLGSRNYGLSGRVPGFFR